VDETYAAVFREHQHRLVRGCLLAAGGDLGLAEDAVVEAFLRVYPHWRRGRVDDVARYLQTTAVHEVRRLQARAARADRPLADDGASTPGRSLADDAGDRAVVAELLQGLSADERHVLVLRFWFDLREVDVAEALGLPLGTVKSHAHRALRRLRDAVPTRGDLDA